MKTSDITQPYHPDQILAMLAVVRRSPNDFPDPIEAK